MSDENSSGSVLSHFWSPLTAVGSHGERGANAQICVPIFGASIVPDRPRLLVNLSKTNYTTGLVTESGSLAITVLAEGQLQLLELLGLHSGRDIDKLRGLDVELTDAGDPWFRGGVAAIDCRVIDSHDLGDSIAFLCGVRNERRMDEERPLPWASARQLVGDDFLRRWAEKSQREREIAYQTMRW